MKVARHCSGRDLGRRKLETELAAAHLDDIKAIAAMIPRPAVDIEDVLAQSCPGPENQDGAIVR
jgi:hypothetical protein